jgi:hypothetical protein
MHMHGQKSGGENHPKHVPHKRHGNGFDFMVTNMLEHQAIPQLEVHENLHCR